jgi:putative polyhydroxyalkanoate system protein
VAEIKITRVHHLGLPQARKVAFQWAEDCEKDLGMECVYVQGEETDEVQFSRSGVHGTLQVTTERFELHAKLGFLVGAFKGKIETEIEKHLDDLLKAKKGGKAAVKSTVKAAGSKKKA